MKKYALLFPLCILFFSCHKNNKIAVDGALYADFAFRPGSYWIYQDSISGETDSMYVDKVRTEWEEGGGCVRSNNAPQVEFIYITIRRAISSVSDSETWTLGMTENKLSVSFQNSQDLIAERIGSLQLFTYPIKAGITGNGNGCIMTPDSGTISPIGTFTAGSGGSYPNAAQSAHASNRPIPGLSYNDCFYTSPTVGFVRMIFDHPADSVHRVLNLMRYKTIR